MRTFLINAIKANKIMPISDLRQYLWKDEINDIFLLTKKMEIYLYWGYKKETIRDAVLGCYCWSYKIMSLLRSKGLIYDLWGTDDGLHTFKTKIEKLPYLLSLGQFKRSPDKNGNWIYSRARKLGHKIIPYKYCKKNDLKEDC